MPGAVALEAVMAASAEAIVLVSVVWAYPVGFEYRLSIRLREPQPHGIPEIGPFFLPDNGHRAPDAPSIREREEFRFAVVFADGRTTHSPSEEKAPSAADPRPEAGIAVRALHEGGTVQRWDSVSWVWPLPPPGPLAFLCAWPAMAIGETCVEIDTGPIREAASRAIELWPPQPAFSANRT